MAGRVLCLQYGSILGNDGWRKVVSTKAQQGL